MLMGEILVHRHERALAYNSWLLLIDFDFPLRSRATQCLHARKATRQTTSA